MTKKEFDIQKLFIGTDALEPVCIIINGKKDQPYVSPVSNSELARAEYEAEQYIESVKDIKKELNNDKQKNILKSIYTLYYACKSKDGKRYFDDPQEIRDLPQNIVDILFEAYMSVSSISSVPSSFNDEDFEDLKKEIKKNDTLLLECSPQWLRILLISFAKDLENLQKGK